MLTYNSSSFTLSSWANFKKFIQDVSKKYAAKGWSACLEESLHAARQAQGGPRFHLHAYLLWVDGVGLRLQDLEPLFFDGVRPRVDVCTTRGSPVSTGAPRIAALRGLWYVSVKKSGTRESDASLQPWVDYKPCAAWLTDLWDQHKLSHSAFLDLSVQFRSGHNKRKLDAEDILRQEKLAAVKEHVDTELTALRTAEPLQEPRPFPVMDEFLAAHQQRRRRRPIFVVVGGTDSGKSELAAHVLRKVCALLGLASFIEVTVEGDEELDMSDFDHRVHGGVLFDGVGDVMTLWKHREVLQGRAKCQLGRRSATMLYSYPYTLANRAVVATLDLSARNLQMLTTNHWLKHERNVLLLRLTGPAWQGPPRTPAASPTPRERMQAWTVDELGLFFSQQDAEGVAEMLRSNSVNGADLLELKTLQEIEEGLRTVPFVAKKILRLKDSFLRGDISTF